MVGFCHIGALSGKVCKFLTVVFEYIYFILATVSDIALLNFYLNIQT